MFNQESDFVTVLALIAPTILTIVGSVWTTIQSNRLMLGAERAEAFPHFASSFDRLDFSREDVGDDLARSETLDPKRDKVRKSKARFNVQKAIHGGGVGVKTFQGGPVAKATFKAAAAKVTPKAATLAYKQAASKAASKVAPVAGKAVKSPKSKIRIKSLAGSVLHQDGTTDKSKK